MIHRCSVLILLLVFAPTGSAQVAPEEVVRVTIRPAAAPVPALKYEFLPEYRDQISGNAVIHYHRAGILAGKSLPFCPHDPPPTTLEKPAKGLPKKKIPHFIGPGEKVFCEF